MHEKSNARKWAAARLAAALSSRNADRIGIPRLTVEMGFGLLLAQRAYRTGSRRPRRFARSASTRFGGSSSGRTTVSDTVYLGSNPSPPAKQGPQMRALFLVVYASEPAS